MRYKWMLITFTIVLILALVLAKSVGLSVDNRGGWTWLGSNFVCKQMERGFSYSTGWPVTNHQAAHFIPYADISANYEPSDSGTTLTLRRVPVCLGVRPKYIPGLVDTDGITIEQWQIEGEGTFGLKSPYSEKDSSLVLYLPSGQHVVIRRMDRFHGLTSDVLPKKMMLISFNLFNGEPNTVIYDYGRHMEFRYNVDWDAIYKLDEGETLELKSVRSVQH